MTMMTTLVYAQDGKVYSPGLFPAPSGDGRAIETGELPRTAGVVAVVEARRLAESRGGRLWVDGRAKTFRGRR